MWTRKELKTKGKEALKRNYWKAVLISFILILLGGGFSPAAFSSSSGHAHEIVQTDETVYTKTDEAAAAQTDETVYVQTFRQMDGTLGIAVMAAFAVFVIIIMVVIMAAEIFIGNPLVVGSQRFMLKSVDGNGEIAELAYSFDHSYLNCVKTMFFRELYVFLWAILFIIPGIYKKYQYYMVEYILAENPDMPYKEVLERSKNIMNGHKWNVFVLDVSFILWHMLGTVTCGISEILYVRPYINMTRASLYRTLANPQNMEGTGI